MHLSKKLLLLIPLLFGLNSCKTENLKQVISVLTEQQGASLTSQEVARGLKEALIQGISRGSSQASKVDGYFKNPQIKIPFPPEVRKVESALRDIGLDSQVDRFILQLNRGAERAAAGARPIFVNAIRSLTIEDALTILRGEPNAATSYLKRTTSTLLKAQFLPVISNALDETKATRYYGDVVTRYNKIPLVKKVNPDLYGYATDRAIEGLFALIAKEEANIRANPVARTTELLDRVFGSQD